MSLLSKIAIGNVRRNLNDFGVYFAALAAGACLMYSYAASGDYLFKLVTDESVRGLSWQKRITVWPLAYCRFWCF